MSHFLVGVIVPKKTKDIGTEVGILLDPYDENEEVEEYMDDDGKPCTYNPDSKWDWYRIGGRWDGVVSKSGKEQPSEDGGFNFADVHELIDNNSCLVRELPAKSVPFAIVTPDGTWHEKGEMGWWGMTKNEKEEQKWEAEVAGILTDHKDDLIVGVDCHI